MRAQSRRFVDDKHTVSVPKGNRLLAMLGTAATLWSWTSYVATPAEARSLFGGQQGDAIDKADVFATVNPRQPLPDSSVETRLVGSSCGTRGGCRDIWDTYCSESSRGALLEAARGCRGLDCITLTIQAAQLENECLSVPRLVANEQRGGGAPPSPHGEVSGFTKKVSQLTRSRAREVVAQAGPCQTEAKIPIRCLQSSDRQKDSFEIYLEDLRAGTNTYPAFAEMYFPDLLKAGRAEIALLLQKAQGVDGACRTQAPNDDTDVDAFMKRQGCTYANMLARRVNSIKDTLTQAQDDRRRAARAQEAARKRTARADEAAAARDELEAAQDLGGKCTDKVWRLNEQAMQTPACRTATAQTRALAQYCADARDLKLMNAEAERMRRVDKASGTVDLRSRRSFAEAKLLLEDRMKQQRRILADQGKPVTEKDCGQQSDERAKNKADKACSMPRIEEALPECAWFCWSYPAGCKSRTMVGMEAKGANSAADPELLTSATAESLRTAGMLTVLGDDTPKNATALARVHVDADGTVKDVSVVQAHPVSFGSIAQTDLASWTFKPYIVDGKATPFYFFAKVAGRRAAASVTCDSDKWDQFRQALKHFCASNPSNTDCHPKIGECPKNAGQRIPILLPADQQDFESEILVSQDKGNRYTVFARFHWDGAWTVTNIRLARVENDEVM